MFVNSHPKTRSDYLVLPYELDALSSRAWCEERRALGARKS